MQISPTSVLRKTDRGTEELKTRRRGLPPRLRQLLILVDGQRSVDEIARAIPQPELGTQLEQLEQGGYVCRADAAGAADAAAGAADAAAGAARAGFDGAAAADADTSTRERQAADAAAGAGAASAGATSTAHASRADLHRLRRRVTQALLEAVGPNGDHLAMRLERAASVEELRSLVPAALSVVEAVGGRRGVDLFLERCGAI